MHYTTILSNSLFDEPLPSVIGNVSVYYFGLLVLLGVYILRGAWSTISGSKAPLVGRRSILEPEWLVGLRFMSGSKPMIQEGYRKFKNSFFRIRRNDGDILVVPNRYLDELRSMPDDQVSAMDAHVKNISGKYAGGSILLEGDLPSRVITQHLTPGLSGATPLMKGELDYALDVEFPDCQNEWVNVSIYELLLRVVARVSARILVGPETCRNEEWLSTAIHFTENSYTVIMTLRMLPSYLHPMAAPFIPAYWRVRANVATAKRIISPIIEQRRARQAKAGPEGYKKDEDLLQWMLDMGNSVEGQPDKLAHRQLMLSLAGIHTTTMSTSHAIYDLCEHPEYFSPLRDELRQILDANGGWHRPIIPKFKKLDSFLKESQRMNPPALIAFNRIARMSIKLSDGTCIPAGTHFCMASDAVLHDTDTFPIGGGDPSKFDPFRWARLREDNSHPENMHRYQFAATDRNNLHFGHGRLACPGRFFASQQIKLILGHLLLRYDFRFAEGQGRPVNMCSDENVFPDPAARVLICRRGGKR
ncbi:cytochrome P450 [Xylariaceae sp. FL0255]|nr:cytochrome P450 [Xylariaceae sp. FL0255]